MATGPGAIWQQSALAADVSFSISVPSDVLGSLLQDPIQDTLAVMSSELSSDSSIDVVSSSSFLFASLHFMESEQITDLRQQDLCDAVFNDMQLPVSFHCKFSASCPLLSPLPVLFFVHQRASY